MNRTTTLQQILWSGLAAAAAALLAVWMARPLTRMGPGPPPPVRTAESGFSDKPVPPPDVFLRRWCYDCHGDGAAKGGLALDGKTPLPPQQWENIRRHVVLRTMPPDNKPAPPAEERSRFESALLIWQAAQPQESATPRLRRLTRREFANSLRDLLGRAPEPDQLPEEETAHGFDNHAGLQPLPPAVLLRYQAVARDTLRTALLPPPVPSSVKRFMPQEFLGPEGSPQETVSHYETATDAVHRLPVNLATAGDYLFSLTAYSHGAGAESVHVRLMDQEPQALQSLDRLAPEILTVRTRLPAGQSTLTFQLANPFQDPRQRDPHRRVRRLLVQEARLEGPLDGDATPAANFVRLNGPVPPPGAGWSQRLEAAGTTLDRLARRAWRRPLTVEESTRLTGLAGQAMAHGLRYDAALVLALEAILTSPHFLFLPDPAAEDPIRRPWAAGARLAYTLWSTLPDEWQLAGTTGPWTPDRLRSTALRLLDDPRAMALARDFAGQWLQLRNTTLARPDPGLFPEITPARLASWQKSSETFFLHLVRQNRPVLELLRAPYHFVESPSGSGEEAGFRKVPCDHPDQAGLLGQPAVLTLTSYPVRSSPVLRGKYVLETLLGLEPPPPPPNVPTLQPGAASPGHEPAPQSLRASLESHRSDPACASCHRAIDPLGFPLEAFDAIGRLRTDAMPDGLQSLTFSGEPIDGPTGLREWLCGPQGLRIVHHTAERLMAYALGRSLSPAETLAARQLADQAGGREARFRDLLLAVLASPAFLGEPP